MNLKNIFFTSLLISLSHLSGLAAQENPFSQENAERVALLKYEAIHPPLDSMRMPAPAANETFLGAHLIRTASLLENSSKDRHNPVKVIIYGQSIVGSALFTQEVTSYLKTKFPEAELTIENKAIGGFTADLLVRSANHDLYLTTADLIIFHVFGGERTGELEQIFSTLRRSSTADVLLMNHHLNATQTKSDGVHPNRNGNWLLAQLVCRHIRYNSIFPSNWYKRVRTYYAVTALDKGIVSPITLKGGNWQLNNASVVSSSKQSSLKLHFTGNRVDINWGHPLKLSTTGNVKIIVDGKPITPSNTIYSITRPSMGIASWWPAIKMISHIKPLIEEDWILKIYEINADSTVFKYRVSGSKTGLDGEGISTVPFISKSGRVAIQPDDVMFTRIRKTFKTTTPNGFEVKWATIPLFKSNYPALLGTDRSKFYKTILVQGLTNGPHILEIVPLGDGPVPIESLEVFEPVLK